MKIRTLYAVGKTSNTLISNINNLSIPLIRGTTVNVYSGYNIGKIVTVAWQGVVWYDSCSDDHHASNFRVLEIVCKYYFDNRVYTYTLEAHETRWVLTTRRYASTEQIRLYRVVEEGKHHDHPINLLFGVIAVHQNSHVIDNKYVIPRQGYTQSAWAARFAAIKTYVDAQDIISQFAEYVGYNYPQMNKYERIGRLYISAHFDTPCIRYSGEAATACVQWDYQTKSLQFRLEIHNNRCRLLQC